MSLYAQLSSGVKEAMKARDNQRRDALRLLLSDLKTLLIDVKVEVPEGADVMETKGAHFGEVREIDFLTNQAKRRRDSMESYQSAGREDLFAKEQYELTVIESFLPQPLTRDEAETIVCDMIAELGVTSRKQFGQVMSKVVPVLKGRFPGNEVKDLVQGLLKD